MFLSFVDGGESPTVDDIRLDNLTRFLEIGASFFHIDADRVKLVAGSLREAFARGFARFRFSSDTKDGLGDDPRADVSLRESLLRSDNFP